MLNKRVKRGAGEPPDLLSPIYGSRSLEGVIPKYELPEGELPARVAYQLVHDELNLDGNPALNMATFVSTWMEPEADDLMRETLGKNYVDADEYPQSAELQNRCVNILAHLYHAPGDGTSVGCATVGSSEAIHLAGLAMKWRWKKRTEAAGRSAGVPNIVMGQNVQVCWEKFARYFEVEPRYVPLSEDRFVLGVDEAISMVDENTIGVVGILGSTYTGEYEPIKELDDALSAFNERSGLAVPVHVDAASGGFVAPFVAPDLEWDFRLPLVCSINVSGHKYGLVYPGVGWVIWRDEAYLPEELIFHVNYLGGDHPTFNLNFSRGAGQIIAQYYNFLRLGRDGYTGIMSALSATARRLADAIDATGHFDLFARGTDLPVVCFALRGDRPYSVFDLSDALRERGWIVPAYTLAPNAEHISVMRVVVREGVSQDMADLLVEDIKRALERLEAQSVRPTTARRHRTKTRGVC